MEFFKLLSRRRPIGLNKLTIVLAHKRVFMDIYRLSHKSLFFFKLSPFWLIKASLRISVMIFKNRLRICLMWSCASFCSICRGVHIEDIIYSIKMNGFSLWWPSCLLKCIMKTFLIHILVRFNSWCLDRDNLIIIKL